MNDTTMLKDAIPYIRAYKGKTFVIKLGGELCEPGVGLENIVQQLTLLDQLGIRLVVVHGGGDHATELGEKLGVSSTFVNGRRVTSPEMLEVAKMSYAGTINTNILSVFRRFQTDAVGLSGVDAGLITAQKREPKEIRDRATNEVSMVDYGLVGDVTAVDPKIITRLLDGGMIPVICSLAADSAGQILNINADVLAGALAVELGATKYCLLTNVDGVMQNIHDPSSLISYFDLDEAQQLIENGVISGGMLPKLTTCIDAVKRGVPRAHIVNGLVSDSLLREILTNEGCGTLLVPHRKDNGEATVFTQANVQKG